MRRLRKAHGLSQEELAQRLGLRGGKSVISGWETGRTACEGPAAELLVRMFGSQASDERGDGDGANRGEDDADAKHSSFLADIDGVWKRAGNFMPAWRQVAILPEGSTRLDRETYARLFPGVEIPPTQHVHGFPFVAHDLPGDVYSLRREGWTGTIPPDPARPVSYLWRLDRNARFVHRERIWEDDPLSVTGGHVHFAAQFNLVVPAVYFYRRLAERCRLDVALACRLQLDLEGLSGRGMVAYESGRPPSDFTVDRPKEIFSTGHLSVSTTATIGEIIADPRRVSRALVGELALVARPDLATEAALDEQLTLRHQEDDDGGARSIRYLGVLDRPHRWRQGTVFMDGTRVGVLSEFRHGTWFRYDEEYRRKPGAVPISPNLPLNREAFERSGGLLTFFSNLLPEGERLKWVAQRHDLDESDQLGVLLAVGRDMIGAIEVHPDVPGRR